MRDRLVQVLVPVVVALASVGEVIDGLSVAINCWSAVEMHRLP